MRSAIHSALRVVKQPDGATATQMPQFIYLGTSEWFQFMEIIRRLQIADPTAYAQNERGNFTFEGVDVVRVLVPTHVNCSAS